MKKTYSILLFIISLSFSPAANADEPKETTRELNGTQITYLYTSGRSYNVKIEEKGVSYRYLTGSKPKTWWGPFPYQAIRVEKNVYFLSWFEEGYGDYVTLLINFDNKRLYGSAIIRGEEVHFHSAEILKIKKP
jgi:hypothetical protein